MARSKSTRTRRNGGSSNRRGGPRKSAKAAMSHDVDGLASDVSEMAGAVGAKTKAQLAALASLAQARSHGALENIENQVRTKPALTLGAVMGMGVVAGLWLARRH